MNNRYIPLLIAALLCLAAIMIQRREGEIRSGAAAISVTTRAEETVIAWRGPVAPPMASRVEEAIAALGPETTRVVFDVSSEGGAVAEGRRVIEALQRVASSRELETRVGARRICLSMCVPIFLQGETRAAAPSARFMFHEPSAVDAVTGERADQPAALRRYAGDRFLERYLPTPPVDEAWRENLRAEWDGVDIWKSGRDLFDERSGIVTELE